jgi:hypothetical protein
MLNNPMPAYSVKTILHTNGVANISIPAYMQGGYYYIVLKHRNSIETWSAAPVQLISSEYDFTTAAIQAYGDGVNAPMKNMGNGVFALYGGDVNQDGIIDGFDLQATENDVIVFAFGYNFSDCTGDGASDGFDLQLIENNAASIIYYARP